MANIERGKEVLEAINQKLENDLEISELSGDGYHLREDSPTVQSLFSNYSEQDQQAAIEYVNAFPDEALKNYNIGLDDLQAKETEKIQENIDPAVQKQISEILTQISNGEPLANIAFDAARREGSDFYKAVQEIATHNVFLQVELEKELYNVTNEGISDLSAHRSFNQQLELMPAEIRLKVAQEIEADPKSTHYTINFTSDDVKIDILKRQEAERKETQTMANEKLPNVREMSSEDLAKEYAKLATEFFVHNRGTEEDKKRIDEIDAHIDSYGASDGGYGKKEFARLVDKYTNGISLIKLHELKAHYDDTEQLKAAQKNKNMSSEKGSESIERSVLEEADDFEFKFIEFDEPKQQSTVEEDIKKASDKVKIDNSQFLYNYDEVDEPEIKQYKEASKQEKRGFFKAIKETFAKASESVASYTAKFVTEAIRPLKEQTFTLQKQTSIIKEQANENFTVLKEQLTSLSKQVVSLTQQLTQQGKQANERIAALEKQVEDYAKENASLKRQIASTGLDIGDTGVQINNKKKFALLENKIIDLQEQLQSVRNENETLKTELNAKTERDKNIMAILNDYKSELDTYKGIIKGTLAVSSLDVVMRIQNEALKENIGCEKADFYRKDPVSNQFYKVNQHNEREYININNGSLISQAVESGKVVIDNDYKSGDIGDNTPKSNPYAHVAVIPYMSKDENGNNEIIGFTVAKDTILNADFNEERISKVATDTLRTVDTKLSNELRHDIQTHDLQTQLQNKLGIRETFESKIYDNIQSGIPVSAIRIGLDNIDALTASYGVDVANKALVQAAEILNQRHRNTDMVFTPARLDANKFMVIIQGDEAQAYNYAEKLNRIISETPVIIGKDADGGDRMISISASIGVAPLDSDEYINKTREQMFDVFKNTSSIEVDKNYNAAVKEGGNRVIADIDVMRDNQQVIDKVTLYYASEEIKTLTTPLLGSNKDDLVSMEKTFDNGLQTITSLAVKGEPELRYNSIVYTDPETYPDELKNKLLVKDYEGIEVINEPTIEMTVGIFDTKSNECLKIEHSEWKPSDLSGSSETIRHKLLEKSTELVKEYEKSVDKSSSKENVSDNRRMSDVEKKNKPKTQERD